MVASASRAEAWWSATICSRVWSAVAHMSSLIAASSSNQGIAWP